MGFLDRIVANLIADSTGLPVRGLVRKVGVGKLLIGGAALAAGGVVIAKMRERSTDAAPTPPPPLLPPTPGAETPPLPPLPPLPEIPKPREAETEVDLGPDLSAAIVRTMIAAALADGHLSEPEREAIHSNLKDSGLSPEQISQAHSDLLNPASPATLASLTRQDSDGEILYRSAFLIIMADKERVETERSWLNDFARRLGLDETRKTTIEDDLISI